LATTLSSLIQPRSAFPSAFTFTFNLDTLALTY
jgi:hypothetical protein